MGSSVLPIQTANALSPITNKSLDHAIHTKAGAHRIIVLDEAQLWLLYVKFVPLVVLRRSLWLKSRILGGAMRMALMQDTHLVIPWHPSADHDADLLTWLRQS